MVRLGGLISDNQLVQVWCHSEISQRGESSRDDLGECGYSVSDRLLPSLS